MASDGRADQTERASVRRYVLALGRLGRSSPALVGAVAPVGWPRTVDRLRLQRGIARLQGADRTAARLDAWLAFLGQPVPGAGAESPVLVPETAAAARRHLALLRLGAVQVEIDRAEDEVADPGFAGPGAAIGVLACAAPLRAPAVLGATLARRIAASAPAMPPIVHPPHAKGNLLSTLVVEAAPALVAAAPVRHLIGRLRRPIVIGLRAGRTTSTVSVARDAIRVRDGLSRHADVVIEGPLETLVRRAAGRVEREAAELTS